MSLSKKLQKVREKPQHVKERILVVTMAIIAALILSIWFLNFDLSKFNFKDTKIFFENSKEYFSSSKGYIFDENMPDGLMESLASGTSTTDSISTSTIQSDKSLDDLNTYYSTTTRTYIKENTSAKFKQD